MENTYFAYFIKPLNQIHPKRQIGIYILARLIEMLLNKIDIETLKTIFIH